jgi:hypothetical protein
LQNYDPINSYYQGAAGGSYRVNQGDSLQRIAQSLYGDSSLWYKIAEANGLSAAAALVEGQTLVLPTGVLNAKNNAGTFKPYNAGEAIGDLSPSTPQPPKKPKCGAFGQILLAVIAIAVTALTYGALGGTALSAWAAVGAGAVAGAAGSIASQAVGVATGIQDKFSFKGVALAAIGGAIGGGLGPKGLFGTNGAFGNIGSQFVGDALRGAVGSALTQGVGVATGLQDKFSWAGVAAAGIGAGIGGAVGRALTSPGGLFGVSASAGSFGYRMATSAASGIANAATRSAINGESFGKNLIAALPDIIGQAVGGAIGSALTGNKPKSDDPVAQLAKLGSFDPITQDILAADEIAVTGTVYHTEDMSLYSSALATSVTGYNVKNRIIKDLHSQYLQAQILTLPKSGTGKDITVKMLSPNGLRDNPNLEGVPTTAVNFTPWQSEHDSRLSTYMAYRAAGIASGEIYDPYDHDWVMKGFADEQVYINEIDAIADRAVWDVAMAGVQPLAFGTGAYRIGVNGEHTFENYLSVASPLIGPLAKYGARFVGSGLRSVGNGASVVEGGAVWKLGPGPRGEAIEQAFGHNLPGNFPVIDRFNNGVASSIKSIDLDGASYLTGNTLGNTLTRYVDKVAGFNGRTWADQVIRSSDIKGRALDVVVPHSGSAAQQATLNQIIKYGSTKGVTVNVIPYP